MVGRVLSLLLNCGNVCPRLLFIVLFFSFSSHSSLFAKELKPGVSREAIAQAWAPIIFQNFSAEYTNPKNEFNPVDHLVSIYFDGNKDLRDNAANIFRITNDQVENALKHVPVYYSVIETKTHYYINYVLYHAIDVNVAVHSHDTENIWTIVQKDHTQFGHLVAQVTNAHGYPMIYSPHPERQNRWRNKLHFTLEQKIMYLLDKNSKDHNLASGVEYLQRDGSQSLKVYVAPRSHAIYKFNSVAWKKDKTTGAVYVPIACATCRAQIKEEAKGSSIFQYELVNWDHVMRTHPINSSMFDMREEKSSAANTAGVRTGFPGLLVPGFGEKKAEVDLFYALHFKTPFALSDPAHVQIFFEGSPEGISREYLYNPYYREPIYKSAWAALLHWTLY